MMNIELSNFFSGVWLTLKMQPVILLYSFVTICSKFAAKQVPQFNGDFFTFLFDCVMCWKLLLIVFAMFCLLFVYAFVWQIIIKNKNIAVVYANKSTYLFWTQLAAALLFNEHISVSNIAGVLLIFGGVCLNNSGRLK